MKIRLLISTILLAIVFLSCEKKKEPLTQQPQQAAPEEVLNIASFNVQFLGSFKKRDDNALASILKDYDIVVIQELVAPPIEGTYPDGSAYSSDVEAKEFFDAMDALGFHYLLSEEDTGTSDNIHTKSTSTEWFVTFFKPDMVMEAVDLPGGFLADDRSNNPDYERVPYAFPFRSANGGIDFVLISVHLQPGDKTEEEQRRKHELATIAAWVDDHDQSEKDFIILGDMNIYSKEELADVTPAGFLSLNDECRVTNTLQTEGGGRPYDHVMIRPDFTGTEIDAQYDLVVIDLVAAMRPYWQSTDPYPGDPYDHNLFKQYYSDHHPVAFRLVGRGDDD